MKFKRGMNIEDLEETLIEIFDKYNMPENINLEHGIFSWWRTQSDDRIKIGYIPDMFIYYSIINDINNILPKIQSRFGNITIEKGKCKSAQSTYIDILPASIDKY